MTVCVHNTPLLLTAELQWARMPDDRGDRAQTAVRWGAVHSDTVAIVGFGRGWQGSRERNQSAGWIPQGGDSRCMGQSIQIL